MSDGRLAFICRQPPSALAVVIATVLGELRPTITEASIDAFADGGWRPEQSADLRALRAVEHRLVRSGQRRIPSGMGIDLDVSRDDEFGLLVRLAAHSIHAEASADTEPVFTSSDTGNHAWFALTPAEATAAATRLTAVGLSFETVLDYRR